MAFRQLARDGNRRSAVVRWNTSGQFKQKLIVFSKKAIFEDSEGNKKHFLSCAEFQEFVFKILIERGEEGWNMLACQKLKPVFF